MTLPLYGLDIETDTRVDGLDPDVAPIVSVAVVTADAGRVFAGDEPELLADLDAAIAQLPPGVIVTWNGSGFDLPFIAHRATLRGASTGLWLRHDPTLRSRRDPLRGHPGAYRASWYGHRHLDAYRLYRADVGPTLGVSCGLKQIARLVGLPAVEVDRNHIHGLSAAELEAYVLSDACLARELAARRWRNAVLAIDVGPARP